MDEKKLLENLAKKLGVEDVLVKIEERKAKESRMIESLAKGMGVEKVLTEMNEAEERAKAELEERRLKEANLLKKLEQVITPAEVVEEVVDEVVETEPAVEQLVETNVVGKQVEPELPKDNIVNKTVERISKEVPSNVQKVVDEIPAGFRKELDILKKSIADFHRFAQRHSQLGGGGAGDVVHLDHPTKTITSPTYAITNKDYYIGVGVTPATITLPTAIKNGRYIIIKDEVGNCSTNPITVLGTVDNDPGGFILAENNGGIQMIYNNGSWRII